MTVDPDLERRLAARLRAELDREVCPRPTWAGMPDEMRTRPRRWALAPALVAAVVVVAVATVGGLILVGGSPSPLPTHRTPTVAPSSLAVSSEAPASEPPLPPGPYDILLDGRAMSGDGWRLLAATLRVQGEPTPGAGAAGSVWAPSDPAIWPKVWMAIGRQDDPPSVDPATEVVVAIDTTAGVGPVCGQVVVDGVTFDAAEHRLTLGYEDAVRVVPIPTPSDGLPSGATMACDATGRAALLVFALDRSHVPTGPITIQAVRNHDASSPVSEARALLVLPPSPSFDPTEQTIDAGFASPAFGWVETTARLLVTEDAGNTWRDATPPIPMGWGASDGVSFRDASVGWLVHNDGPVGGGSDSAKLSLWHTEDGGRTWRSSRMPSASQGFDSLGRARFVWVDAQHVVIDLGGGMSNGYADDIFATADGGRTWPIAVNAGEGVTGVPVFADAEHGFLVGGAGGDRVYATRDGGRTWKPGAVPIPHLPADRPEPTFWDARFFTATDGLLLGMVDTGAGQAPVVYRTSDTGRTWVIAAVGSDPVTGCTLLSLDAWTCFSSWTGTLGRWTEGGKIWPPGTITGLPPNAETHLIDAQHGWGFDAQSDPAGLYLTSDGGSTWRRVVPGA